MPAASVPPAAATDAVQPPTATVVTQPATPLNAGPGPEAGAAAGSEPPPPPPAPLDETALPADPLAAKAHAVLDRHCARCHQAGRLATEALPAGGFGNVLALSALARNPALVVPGEPDASPLYQQMVARQMPTDVLRRPPSREAAASAPAKAAADVATSTPAATNTSTATSNGATAAVSNGATASNGAAASQTPPAAMAAVPAPATVTPTVSAPDADDLAAVRDWIAALPPNGAACSSSAHIDAGETAADITAWIDAIGPERAADVRFVSLAGIANGCPGDAALAAARQGVVRLLNSLSWVEKLAPVDTVGDKLALLAFRLSDLGWTREHWELLLSRLSPAARIGVDRRAEAATGTSQPVVAADWLAATASEPDVYARLLGLPPSLEALAGLAGVALDDERESRSTRRGALLRSAETGGARFIEHYPARRGMLWLAHDVAAPDAESSPFDHPLQPWSLASRPATANAANAADATGAAQDGDDAPTPMLGTRVLLQLPNGLTAFASYDGQGELDMPPLRRAASELQPALASAPPAAPAAWTSSEAAASPVDLYRRAAARSSDCSSCHVQGALGFADRLAGHLAGSEYGGSDVEREVALQVLFAAGEIDRRVAEQAKSVADALVKAGIHPGTTFDGREPVSGLAARYRRDVDLAGAAAEMLTSPTELVGLLGTVPEAVRTLAQRLRHGRLPRAQFELLRSALITPGAARALAAGPVIAPSSAAAEAAGAAPLRLDLWPAETPRSAADAVRLVVRASAACHVTLVNVDGAGKATVLFPSEFDRDNLLKPGEERQIPARDASYRFRLQPGAPERFVAICEDGEPVPAGMVPDFTRQNFTALGDWRQFLASAHKAAGAPRVPLDHGDDPDRRFRRGKRAVEPMRPAPAVTPAQARAAVTLRVGG